MCAKRPPISAAKAWRRWRSATMFSFLNPAHEQRIKALLQEELPGVYVTAVAARCCRRRGFYERGSTTVFNACVGPLLRRYIDDLLARLGEAGFRGRFLTMQSNGGVMPPEVVQRLRRQHAAVRAGERAPSPGCSSPRRYAIPNLITVDMGGTSFDVCLIRDGRAAITSQSRSRRICAGASRARHQRHRRGRRQHRQASRTACWRSGRTARAPSRDRPAYGARRRAGRPSPTPISCSACSIPAIFSAARKKLRRRRRRARHRRHDIAKPLGLTHAAGGARHRPRHRR